MAEDSMALLRRRVKDVAVFCNDRISSYYESDVFKGLKNRVAKLNDMIDMKYGGSSRGYKQTNSWRSNISMPLVRESYLALRSMTVANFRNDPLLSVQPTAGTPSENADVAQMVLESNLRETHFRDWAFREMVESSCRFGASVVVPRYRQEYRKFLRTEPMMISGQAVGTERRESKSRKNMVRNWCLDIRNYFQDPTIANPYDSPYQGYIDRVTLAQFIADVKANKDQYFMDTVKKIVDKAEKEALADTHYTAMSRNELDWRGIDIRYIYTTLPIRGNEGDDTDYLVEMVGEDVVRLTPNPWDYAIRPIIITTFDKRWDRWYGNTPAESSVPHENYLNLVLQMAADQGIRELENYVFYNRALGIDVADINNRAQNGGWVPIDAKPDQRMQDAFFMFAPTAGDMKNFDYVVREVKEANQRVQPKMDVARKPNEGGSSNKTATAAMYMQEEGDIQQNFYLWQFADGLREIGQKDLVILQQLLPDMFQTRRSPNDPPVEVEKWQMVGEFAFDVHSSLTKNKQIQLMNVFNLLTAINNFKGMGASPTFGAIQDGRIIRRWLKDALPDEDIDKIAPLDALEQAGRPQPQGMPGMGGIPGMPGAGGQMMPAPMPQPQPQGVAGVA